MSVGGRTNNDGAIIDIFLMISLRSSIYQLIAFLKVTGSWVYLVSCFVFVFLVGFGFSMPLLFLVVYFSTSSTEFYL